MNKLCLFICIMIIKYVYSVLTSGVSFGQLSFLKMEEIGFGDFWTLCVCVCVCECVHAGGSGLHTCACVYTCCSSSFHLLKQLTNFCET
jgi:hypothetical protein